LPILVKTFPYSTLKH